MHKNLIFYETKSGKIPFKIRMYGPGYRVYFAELSNKGFILLLFIGRKQDQNKDIQREI